MKPLTFALCAALILVGCSDSPSGTSAGAATDAASTTATATGSAATMTRDDGGDANSDDASTTGSQTGGDVPGTSGATSVTTEGGATTGGVYCIDARDCQNGDSCDGIEVCVDGLCQAGEPIDCDDGIACTIDACDEASGACVHVPAEALCDAGETCTFSDGCVPGCVLATCEGKIYACGNCLDDDGDGLIDMADPECWGPCSDNEAGWEPAIPADDGASPCSKADCYFDLGTGMSGNDDCHWSFSCDPLEPFGCTYDADATIPGSSSTCDELAATQSNACLSFCGPLTPNGCDCFGCCEVHVEGGPVTIFLGTNLWGASGESCHLGVADDPSLCHPCTQVPACVNPCGPCELCLGKSELPDDCPTEAQCPGGEQACGVPGQNPCPAGFYCNTGCCTQNP
jgi:hypothetical protein